MVSWQQALGAAPLNQTAASARVSSGRIGFMVCSFLDMGSRLVRSMGAPLSCLRQFGQGESIPWAENWPMTLDPPSAVAATTVIFPPAQLETPNGIVTTIGLFPSLAVPRDWNWPQEVTVKNVTEPPAGTTDESKASTALVPETNPGTALLGAEA